MSAPAAAPAHRPRRILVIIGDRLSDLVRKGEVTARYYNPGDLFDEVHILLVNDDHGPHAGASVMAGRAALYTHNLPPPSFVSTLGWRPWLMRRWAAAAVALAREIRPDLVRCHAPWLNAFAAAEIKRALGIPFVLSLHINTDVDLRGRTRPADPKPWLVWHASASVERVVMPVADAVLPVYQPARVYAERLGARRVEVVYNKVNVEGIVPKASYALSAPPRVIAVGRQFEPKFPEHVIRACALLGAEITLVGDGPAHGRLRDIARSCAASAVFVPSMPNDALSEALHRYDVFATHTEYWEISKAVIEAMHAGLPLIINRRHGAPVPELQGEHCLIVENTTAAYAAALRRLFDDEALRARVGRRARDVATHCFSDAQTERRVAAIYRELMAGGQPR